MFSSCYILQEGYVIKSSDARVLLSTYTLRFDTVFTTAGSVTQYFKLKNDNNQKLLVNHVTLAGGTASPFRINVDGTAGPDVKDIEMQANDSIYIFVSVSINPDARNLLCCAGQHQNRLQWKQAVCTNFRLKPGSPAVNAGMSTGLPFDLNGRPRTVGPPDLGAYESP